MLDVRESDHASLAEFAKSVPHLSQLEDTLGLYKEIVPAKLRGKTLNIDTGRRLNRWEPSQERGAYGALTFTEVATNQQKTVPAFQKTIPCIDAYHWMRFKERPHKPLMWQFQRDDIVNPENQAYVDATASALVAAVGRRLKSPHFCDFYGAVRGFADIFHYNLAEDFDDFRFTKWFWAAIEANEIGLRAVEKKTGRRLTTEEVLTLFKPDDEFLSDEDSDSDSEDESEGESGEEDSETSSIGAEDLPCVEEIHLSGACELEDAASIQSSKDVVEVHRTGAAARTASTISTASQSSTASFRDEYDFHAELYDMPVVNMYLERMEGTMDSLLEQHVSAPISSPRDSEKWAAWLLQVVFACAQLQGSLNLTHNDLHTNNVLFRRTEQETLFYKDSEGRIWKVPTYGYIFTIIDYGRAIFTCNSFTVISSDYNDGHDAYGMYNFGVIYDDEMPRIFPNKSFDLCRLSCSLLRGLYPQNPPSLANGKLMTKEGSWEIKETAEPLFNLLWTWLKDKSGQSILEDRDGGEKYPGFDLYITIATGVSSAVPARQLDSKVFTGFKSNEGVPQHIYVPL